MEGRFYFQNEPLEIKETDLLICENNIYAVILLSKFYYFTYWSNMQSQGMYDDYEDPAIYNSLDGIVGWTEGLYDGSLISDAFILLLNKGYIVCEYVFNDDHLPSSERILKTVCNIEKVDAARKQIKYPSKAIHAPYHTAELIAEEEERRKYWQPATPQKLQQIEKEEKEARVVKSQNTRARKAKLPYTLTLEQWLQTLDYFDWKCAYCGEKKYEVLEHFIPLAHGKGTTQDNCVPACGSCNVQKLSWNPLSTYGPDLSHMKEGIDRVKLYFASLSQEK